jgi:hypothetical protein
VRIGFIYRPSSQSRRFIPAHAGNAAAREALKAPRDLPFGYLPEQVDLWNASGDTQPFIDAITKAAADLTAPLSLIVVDTHAQASAGADENKAEPKSESPAELMLESVAELLRNPQPGTVAVCRVISV